MSFPLVSDLESIEEIQELLREVQLVIEMKMASKMRQVAGDNGAAAEPNLQCKCAGLECSCCHLIQIRRLRFSKNCE